MLRKKTKSYANNSLGMKEENKLCNGSIHIENRILFVCHNTVGTALGNKSQPTYLQVYQCFQTQNFGNKDDPGDDDADDHKTQKPYDGQLEMKLIILPSLLYIVLPDLFL